MSTAGSQPVVPRLELSLQRRSSLRQSSRQGRTSNRVHYSRETSFCLSESESESEAESSSEEDESQTDLQPRRSSELIVTREVRHESKGSEQQSFSKQDSSRPSSKRLSSLEFSTNGSLAERFSRGSLGANLQSSTQSGVGQEVIPIKEWGRSSTAELIEERRNSQYFATIAKVAFETEEYNTASFGIGASVDFFKMLAPNPEAKWKAHPDAASGKGEDSNVGRLQLLIPPTVVFNRFEVMGFFTSEDGYVVRRDELHRADIYQMLLSSSSEGPLPSHTPVAVQKLRRGRWHTDAHLVLSSELNSYLDSSKLSGNCALQQFVKCAGPKVSIVRCIWRASGLRPSQVFLIGSRRKKGTRPPNDVPTRAQSAGCEIDVITKALRHAVIVQGYLNTIEFPRACHVQPVTGRGWAEPLELTQRIARHVERHRKLSGRFQEMVADFIHGEDGRWWFLQVKAFKIAPFEPSLAQPLLRASTERRTRECRGDYCRTLGMDDNIDAMHQEGRGGSERRRPKGFDSLSRAEKRKYLLDQLNKERKESKRFQEQAEAKQREAVPAVRMVLNKSIILDRMEMQGESGSGPEDERAAGSGATTERSQSRTPRRFSDFLRELEQRREQAKAERQALYTRGSEEEELGPDPLPKPQRKVPILQHEKLPAFYYELVPVCSDCFRVYLAKDHQRALGEDAARYASLTKGGERSRMRGSPKTAR